jgi:hypothetical protein
MRLARFASPVLFAAACSNNAAPSDAGTTPPDLSFVVTCTPDGKPVQLATRYAIDVTLAVNVKEPPSGAIVDVEKKSELLLLADVTQTGLSVNFTAHACRITIPPVQIGNDPPTVLTAPDALVQGLQLAPSTSPLDGPNTCAHFDVPTITLVIGARLAMPASDPLPLFSTKNTPPVKLCGGMASTACDATQESGCVCDQDKDGKPGATVMASGIPGEHDVDKVYLALRTSLSLSATVLPPSTMQPTPGQRFKGEVLGLKLDQSVVGCHHQAAADMSDYDCPDAEVGSIAGLNPLVTQSELTASSFVALPVGNNEDCTALIADAPSLFRNQ